MYENSNWRRNNAMTKEEILAKVEEREYENRCVNAKICPKCGGNLSIKDCGHLLDAVCNPCNLSFPYV